MHMWVCDGWVEMGRADAAKVFTHVFVRALKHCVLCTQLCQHIACTPLPLPVPLLPWRPSRGTCAFC